MRFYHIAVNNFRRRKTNMVFLITGMVVGIATLVALFLLTQAMESSLSEDFDAMGSRVLILPKTDQASFSFGGVMLAEEVTYDIQLLSVDVLEKIKDSPTRDNLLAVAPRYISNTEVRGINMNVVAIDFGEEVLLRPYWKIEGNAPEENNQILLGRWAADSLGLSPGQKVDVFDETYTVTGILEELGEQDDYNGFITLGQSDHIIQGQYGLSYIELLVESNNKSDVLDEVITALSAQIPEARVTSVKEAIDVRREMVQRFKNFFLLVSGLMLLIASLSAATSMQSSVNERTKELGIFRAMGFRKKHIIKIIAIEANILSVTGGILGYLIGTGIAFAISRFINDFKLAIKLDPVLALSVIALAAAIGTVSSAYPAIRGASMDPADALRQI